MANLGKLSLDLEVRNRQAMDALAKFRQATEKLSSVLEGTTTKEEAQRKRQAEAAQRAADRVVAAAGRVQMAELNKQRTIQSALDREATARERAAQVVTRQSAAAQAATEKLAQSFRSLYPATVASAQAQTKAAASANSVAANLRAARAAVAGVQGKMEQYDSVLKAVDNNQKRAASSAGKGGGGSMLGGLTKLAAQVFLLTRAFRGLTQGTKAFFEGAKEGAQIQSVTAFFNKAGKSIQEYRKATLGMISDAELMRKANLADSMGISEEAFKKLAVVAKAASLKTGQSYEHMFNSIQLGTARSSRLLLDNLGIIVSVESANKSYAQRVKEGSIETMTAQEKEQARNMTLNQIIASLSDTAKKQAFLDEVLKQSNGSVKEFNELGDQASTKIAQFEAALQNLADAFKMQLVPALVSIIPGITTFAELMTEALTNHDWEAVGKSIGYALLGGMYFVLQSLPGGDFLFGKDGGVASNAMDRSLQVLQDSKTEAQLRKVQKFTQTREKAEMAQLKDAVLNGAADGWAKASMSDLVLHVQTTGAAPPSLMAETQAAVMRHYQAGVDIGKYQPYKPPQSAPEGGIFNPKDRAGTGKSKKTKEDLDGFAELFFGSFMDNAGLNEQSLTPAGLLNEDIFNKANAAFMEMEATINSMTAGDEATIAVKKMLIEKHKEMDEILSESGKLRKQLDDDEAKRERERIAREQKAWDTFWKNLTSSANEFKNAIANVGFAAIQGRSVGRSLDRALTTPLVEAMAESERGRLGIGASQFASMSDAEKKALSDSMAPLIGGVGAIVSISLQLLDQSESFNKLLDAVIGGIKNLLKLGLDPLLDGLKPLHEPLYTLISAIGNLAGAILRPLGNALTYVSAGLGIVVEAISALIIVLGPFVEIISGFLWALGTLGITAVLGLAEMVFYFLAGANAMTEFQKSVLGAGDALLSAAIGFNNFVVSMVRRLTGQRNFGSYMSMSDFRRSGEDEGDRDALRDNTAALRSLTQEIRNAPAYWRGLPAATFGATSIAATIGSRTPAAGGDSGGGGGGGMSSASAVAVAQAIAAANINRPRWRV